MSDQEDDKKLPDEEKSSPDDVNQSSVEKNNQPEGVDLQSNETSPEENQNKESSIDETQNNNQNLEADTPKTENNNQNDNNLENLEVSNEKKEENGGSSHQVIHKKDGRLHIYVRQDKYKGELKSKNWVGRLYIDGKQKISSSGTTNLEEAIPILEKWFDDVHEESEKLKKQSEETQNIQNQTPAEETQTQTTVQENIKASATEKPEVNQTNESSTQTQTPTVSLSENVEKPKGEELKGKLTNIFGKLKEIKLKKPSFAKNLSKPSLSSFNKGKIGGFKSKFESFFKSKLGKSSIQGEEILGVQLYNNEIRLVQISSNKANQWVLDKFYVHKFEGIDEN